jgi:hypothetical protein
MPIPTWQAAGLSLAVLVGHVLIGSGALVFGVLSIGVIWALHRLHGRAPESRTTAELIASVPGTAPARAVSVIQFAAYVVIAAYAARTVASIALIWLSSPEVTFPEWSQAALAVAVVAIASVGVGAMPTRVLAPVVTVLAVFGLLVFFYVSLAVIAKVASGAAPIQPMFEMGAIAAPTEWGPAALVVSLAIAFAGFEIPTVASHRLRSVGRPLGYATALVVLCATLAWVATNMATTGDFRYSAGDLTQVATAMFGYASGFWLLLAATMAQAVRRFARADLGRGARRPVGARARRVAVGGGRGRDDGGGGVGGRRLGRRGVETVGCRRLASARGLLACRTSEFTVGRFQHRRLGAVRGGGGGGGGSRHIEGPCGGLVAGWCRRRHPRGCGGVGREAP